LVIFDAGRSELCFLAFICEISAKAGDRLLEKVVFAGKWQKFFAKFGLDSFDDFFDYSQGQTINKNTRRNVSELAFDEGDNRKVFFRKRFFSPHVKDMIFAWRSFGRLISQAALEWHNANMLFENGIETYRPVCYGAQTKFSLERKSFLITEMLPGMALTDFVSEKWSQLSQQQKEAIIVSLGKLVRKIHEAQISMPDLYLWHVFIKEIPNSEQYDLAVIDLHRMGHNISNQNQLLKNLGRLDHSMPEKYFDERLRKLLIESYAGDNRPEEITNLIQQVKKCSNAISVKRRTKPY
jgi:hypothetical protein